MIFSENFLYDTMVKFVKNLKKGKFKNLKQPFCWDHYTVHIFVICKKWHEVKC